MDWEWWRGIWNHWRWEERVSRQMFQTECHTEKQWPVSEDSKPQTCSYLPAQCFGTEWHYILIRFRHWWQCMITDPSSSSSSHISCATSHALGALSTLLSLLVQWSFSLRRIFPYKTWTLLNILGRISLFFEAHISIFVGEIQFFKDLFCE